MSIAILISVHDGLVLASDSASTLMVKTQKGEQGVVGVYNNANKIVNLYKGYPIGCVAFGAGSIGNASISTLLKDFRARLDSKENPPFNIKNYTMKAVANALSEFLEAECRQSNVPAPSPPSLGILLAGHSTGKNLGEGWSIQIEGGKALEPVPLRAEHEVGISWGGEAEAVVRLILGYGTALPDVLKNIIKTDQPQIISQIVALLRQNLQAPVVFPPMPIQDAIDLAAFLVHASIMYSRFTPGAPTVGGPIEIAAITKHEGFKWVSRKHYYDRQINPEQLRREWLEEEMS